MKTLILSALAASIALSPAHAAAILNVSYDPTRELYKEIDSLFARNWQAKTGEKLTIKLSHGGSGKQARAVIDGLEADVVTLALAYDIDAIAERSKLIPADWQQRLPHNSAPYYSTIVFLVRKGNPKNIRDWNDLVRPGIGVITPNPKTSGGARWNYLAAFGYAFKAYGSKGANDYMVKLFKNVPVLDSGARGSTTSFVQRGQGDVLIAWENEALLAQRELGKGKFDIIYPSVSILAEPPVTIVDGNVKKHRTEKVSKAYLEYLYTAPAQDVIAKNYYRPRDPKVSARYTKTFPRMQMFTIDRNFGGWKRAHAAHFADGGLFDRIFEQAQR